MHEQPRGDYEELDSDEITINNDEKTINNNNLSIINNILKQPECKAFLTINNKELLIRDILNQSMINNILKQPITNDLKEWLKPKKAILNPLNKDDNKSFQYSITLSLHHKDIGSNPCRIKNMESFINNFNWENINFPPQEHDYQQLETNNNSIALNILTTDSQQKIIHLYKSKYNKTRENKVILLQLQNNHYTSVKKLNSLLKTKNDSSKKLLY